MAFATPLVILIAQQINAYYSAKRAGTTKAAVAEVKAVTGEKLDTIHGIVNGRLTAANESIAALTAQNALLTAEIARLKNVTAPPGNP